MHKGLFFVFGAAALSISAPVVAQPRGDEPVAVPRAIKQGIDFVYVDPQMSTVARKRQRPQNWLARIFNFDFSGGRRQAPNVLFTQLGQGMQRYQAIYGRLPQVKVPAGPTLKRGSTGRRVQLLRQRLGLAPGGGYDQQLFQAVATYQTVHGIGPADGIAGRNTIVSLNRGSNYYMRKLAINVERAWRLPQTRTFDRYVVVDSGAAEVYLFDRDRIVDGMRVIVGSPKTKTPMIAVIMRNAKANPYWHVPPELVRSLTAKRVNQEGLSYLRNFHYEVLSDWGPNAQKVDPKTINWKAVASGRREPSMLVRQQPGPWNSMGKMKFEMPNDFGIYLHDTPLKEKFAGDRWISNGCVRLEDYQRFARWVFGNVPQTTSAEQRIDLPRPIPVYLTYLTAEPSSNFGVVFRPDPYGFDAQAMPQMFGPGQVAEAPSEAEAAAA